MSLLNFRTIYFCETSYLLQGELVSVNYLDKQSPNKIFQMVKIFLGTFRNVMERYQL